MDIKFLDELKKIKKAKFKKHTEQEPMLSIIERLDKLYSPEESSFLKDLVRCQKLIIFYSKQLDFDQAFEIISLSKGILKELEEDARVLGKIFLYPSFAYYYKKNNNLGLAKKYINQTIKYDDLLSQKFPILHLHKIHHILNLHQLLIERKEFKKCATLFVDVFRYLNEGRLPSKFGISGTEYLKRIYNQVSTESLIDNFSRTYFICIWDNPDVEKYFLSNREIKFFLNQEESKNEYLNAFKDFNILQKLFMQNKEDTNLILKFFKRYNFYHFDSYKLLIIQNLISLTKDERSKNILLEIIRTNLNFKEPELIINRIDIS